MERRRREGGMKGGEEKEGGRDEGWREGGRGGEEKEEGRDEG